MRKTIFIKTSLSLTLLLFLLPAPAYAYLDPGTGSYIIQMLVGAVLGGLFTVKLFWKNIKDFFGGRFSRGRKNESD